VKNLFYFLQILAAMAGVACILSVPDAGGVRIKMACRKIRDSDFVCRVKGSEHCEAGEEYVDSRHWCDDCFAVCCPACVTTVGT
jgi:hypothetical protein